MAGSSVELSGLTNASSGLFSITLNSDSSSSNNQQQQLSGQSSFLAPATLFYASGLARDATHTLTVTNLENKSLSLSDLSITVVQADKRFVVPFVHLHLPLLSQHCTSLSVRSFTPFHWSNRVTSAINGGLDGPSGMIGCRLSIRSGDWAYGML